MSNPFAYITEMINSMGDTTLYWIVGSLLAVLLVFWLIYRIVKAAVRSAIREAGLVVSQPHMVRPRKPQDPKYDFVYTEPHSEH